MLFGLSAPLAKLLLDESLPPVLLAGIFYLGGGLGLAMHRILHRPSPERALRAADAPLLAAVVVLGGMGGPALMMLGLARTSATAGSLLLNLEAPLVILLAVVAFGERLSRRGTAAACMVIGGAALLGIPNTEASFVTDPIGALFLALACALWGLDTNLMRVLSERDPFSVSLVKTSCAGLANVALGVFLERPAMPRLGTLAAAAVVGFFSYGLSTVLASMALRRLGAARHAAYFATAPFFGALASMLLFAERPTALGAAAMLAMAVGVVVLLRERTEASEGDGLAPRSGE